MRARAYFTMLLFLGFLVPMALTPALAAVGATSKIKIIPETIHEPHGTPTLPGGHEIGKPDWTQTYKRNGTILEYKNENARLLDQIRPYVILELRPTKEFQAGTIVWLDKRSEKIENNATSVTVKKLPCSKPGRCEITIEPRGDNRIGIKGQNEFYRQALVINRPVEQSNQSTVADGKEGNLWQDVLTAAETMCLAGVLVAIINNDGVINSPCIRILSDLGINSGDSRTSAH